MNVLEIINLHKSFGDKFILKNIQIECKTGDIIGIFGRNGSGKSTLLKTIFGTLKADAIQIKINSDIIAQKDIIPSQKIAYLPQDSFLPKNLKVRALIPLFFSDGNDQDKIFYASNVHNFENTKIGNLSLGELRYLELLLIGNLNHPFLLLDEPFSMIEPLYKEIIKNLLFEFKKTKGIILTDHYYHDVLEVSNKNYLIKDAEKIEIKSTNDLKKLGYLSSSF